MKWTAQQKIRVGFALLLFVPVVLGLLVWRNAHELTRTSQELAVANDTSRRLERLFSLVKDVEVAQREYIVLGSDQAIEVIQKRTLKSRRRSKNSGRIRRISGGWTCSSL
jgi:CHASE3 domain sensor protein